MFFQIQKMSKNYNYEKAENTTPSITDAQLTAINNQIQTIYNMDVEAIRNLGAISKSLLTGTNYHSTTVGTPGTLTIPADNTVLTGGLFVYGKQLIPLGIILAWYQTIAPAGWGLCNGDTYGSIKSPDLRSRFIIGAGQGDGLLNRPINSIGGEETHILAVNELPAHTHSFDDQFFSENLGASGGPGTDWGAVGADKDNSSINLIKYKTSGSTGSNLGHNTIPPFYALTYIIYIG